MLSGLFLLDSISSPCVVKALTLYHYRERLVGLVFWFFNRSDLPVVGEVLRSFALDFFLHAITCLA